MDEQQYTVNQILDRYVRDCMEELAPRTQRDYLKHIRRLREWFGERIASELKPRDFSTFIDIKGRGRFNRNKTLAVLSAAFTQAVQRWYWIDRNVLRDVWRHPSKPRDRLVIDAEFASMRASAPLRIQLMMDLALNTGQRQGDLLTMRWDAIKDGAWHLQQGKTGKRMAITLSPNLKRVLGKCMQLPDCGNPREYVILNESGMPYTSDGFRSIWQRAMRSWVRRGNTRFTFHDLRAMCATQCETIEEASKLLGHSSLQMTRRVYRRGIEYVEPLKTHAPTDRTRDREDHRTTPTGRPGSMATEEPRPSFC
jgi:integrase